MLITTRNITRMTKSKRRYRYTLVCKVAGLLLFVVMLTGCEKFLDVPPKDKVPQADLLKDEQGFKDALTGVYLSMDKPQSGGSYGLYTTNLSMGMLSTLAYNYDNATSPAVGVGSTFYNNVVYYAYTDATVRAELDGIWAGMDNNIANLNKLLDNAEGKKEILTRDNYNRVKGEAIALRALFHFDLLRMFGQPPLTGSASKAVPYVTQFTVTPTSFATLQAGLDSCVADLTIAKDFLART